MRVPIKNEKCAAGYEMIDFGILEPFTVVKYMFCEAGVQVNYAQVAEFWKHHRDVRSPWAIHSKASDRHIPLGLHADGAKIRQLAYCQPQKIEFFSTRHCGDQRQQDIQDGCFVLLGKSTCTSTTL